MVSEKELYTEERLLELLEAHSIEYENVADDDHVLTRHDGELLIRLNTFDETSAFMEGYDAGAKRLKNVLLGKD